MSCLERISTSCTQMRDLGLPGLLTHRPELCFQMNPPGWSWALGELGLEGLLSESKGTFGAVREAGILTCLGLSEQHCMFKDSENPHSAGWTRGPQGARELRGSERLHPRAHRGPAACAFFTADLPHTSLQHWTAWLSGIFSGIICISWKCVFSKIL